MVPLHTTYGTSFNCVQYINGTSWLTRYGISSSNSWYLDLQCMVPHSSLYGTICRSQLSWVWTIMDNLYYLDVVGIYTLTHSYGSLSRGCRVCAGRAPTAIRTDQCKAMRRAIEIVFPNTHHRWCFWRIMKNPKKLRGYHQYEAIKRVLQNQFTIHWLWGLWGSIGLHV